MAGTLFLVSTPIGNLEDITLRGLRTLREADVIAAEDTRRTAKLLSAHGIATPTLSFHSHNIASRLPQLLTRLERGDLVALVTDAGTPSVSDPGLELVQACIERGVAIDPIPGPSAPLTAVVASGFPLSPLTIFGFAPHRAKARNEWFAQVALVPHTVTFFETPHRIEETLRTAAEHLGDRPLMIGRELTKAHQEFLRGTAEALLPMVKTPKGEYTVVAGPSVASREAAQPPSDEQIFGAFGEMTNRGGLGRRAAVSALARAHGMTGRDVYAAIERHRRHLSESGVGSAKVGEPF